MNTVSDTLQVKHESSTLACRSTATPAWRSTSTIPSYPFWLAVWSGEYPPCVCTCVWPWFLAGTKAHNGKQNLLHSNMYNCWQASVITETSSVIVQAAHILMRHRYIIHKEVHKTRYFTCKVVKWWCYTYSGGMSDSHNCSHKNKLDRQFIFMG